MTVDQAIIAKKTLESQILVLVLEFERTTGLTVNSLKMNDEFAGSDSIKPEHVIYSEVRL